MWHWWYSSWLLTSSKRTWSDLYRSSSSLPCEMRQSCSKSCKHRILLNFSSLLNRASLLRDIFMGVIIKFITVDLGSILKELNWWCARRVYWSASQSSFLYLLLTGWNHISWTFGCASVAHSCLQLALWGTSFVLCFQGLCSGGNSNYSMNNYSRSFVLNLTCFLCGEEFSGLLWLWGFVSLLRSFAE